MVYSNACVKRVDFANVDDLVVIVSGWVGGVYIYLSICLLSIYLSVCVSVYHSICIHLVIIKMSFFFFFQCMGICLHLGIL